MTATITRRDAIAFMGAAASLSVAPRLAAAAAPYADTRNAGFYRFRLGEREVTALSDGTIPLPMADIFQGPAKAELQSLLDENFLGTEPHASINAFLVNDGTRLVLVDAGSGSLFGPAAGKLPQSIVAAGYAPEQIDAVILTHIHTDHSGGLTVDGRRQFPNADLHVAAPEMRFWIDDPLPAGLPELVVTHRREAEASVRPYLEADRVRRFEPGISPLPGFGSIAEFGHTPGHCGIVLEGGGGPSIVFWGDIVHGDYVQFDRPEITVLFDIDQEAASGARERALNAASDGRYLVAGAHLPFPGIGHVARDETNFRFVPLNFTL